MAGNKFTQCIRHGRYTDDQKTRLVDHINSLKIDEKREYEVTIKPYKMSKTLEQLGYYFPAVVGAAMEWQGMDNEQAHQLLKSKCLEPVFFSALDGSTYEYKPSVKKMNIKPMAEYIDRCIKFLGSEGVYVPPPRYKG